MRAACLGPGGRVKAHHAQLQFNQSENDKWFRSQADDLALRDSIRGLFSEAKGGTPSNARIDEPGQDELAASTRGYFFIVGLVGCRYVILSNGWRSERLRWIDRG